MIVDYLARVPEAPEEEDIDGEAVLKAIAAQHGLLVERSQRIFSFSHLTFQEYFTAKYIVDNEARGSLNELMPHAFDDPWREVFLLVASLLDDADDFFDCFIMGLNRYVVQHDLKGLLFWADETANHLQKEIVIDAEKRNQMPLRYNAAAIRSWAISYARVRDYARDRDLDLTLARALDLNLAGVRTLDLALALALASTLARARARAPAFDFDLDLHLNLNRALARARDLVIKLGHFDFSKALTEVNVPLTGFSKGRQSCTEQLQAVIAEYRPSALVLGTVQRAIAEKESYPELTDAQWQSVNEYLKGVRLLVDCLDVAYVSDRKAIEDQLLLPPS